MLPNGALAVASGAPELRPGGCQGRARMTPWRWRMVVAMYAAELLPRGDHGNSQIVILQLPVAPSNCGLVVTSGDP